MTLQTTRASHQPQLVLRLKADRCIPLLVHLLLVFLICLKAHSDSQPSRVKVSSQQQQPSRPQLLQCQP